MRNGCEDEISLNFSRRQSAGRPKKATAPAPPRIPRIARLMALAIKFQDMVDRGEVCDYAEIARLGYVTRARLTQIMNMLLLAPDIQTEILASSSFAASVPESGLRRLTTVVLWDEQRKLINELRPSPHPEGRFSTCACRATRPVAAPGTPRLVP